MMTARKKGSRLTGRTVRDTRKHFQIHINAEGEKTEETYLTYWNRQHRGVRVVIAVHASTTPMALVADALKKMRADKRRSKREGKAFDEYWCVFDNDDDPSALAALRLASENGIKVAFSSPCFELWLLLHFRAQTAWIHRQDAGRLAYERIGCGEKSRFTQRHVGSLDGQYPVAMERAEALHVQHAKNDIRPPWNPCSNMFELTETIKNGHCIEGAGVPHRAER
jgi:hypothetical protein